MPLSPGTKLGPYQIVAPLGAGGMGEVYRATDSRLGRDVAIKVLPSHLADTPDLRARFDREARTISQLNHPNICTLYDVGHQDGVDYLVMELIEGETLATRLEKGALPLADVLTIGRQMAQALERAHRAGVVHRDLKPGNIMLTRAGAKLMDFGLARPQDAPQSPASSHSAMPTMAAPLTAEGAIVGTFQYMAPEQLEGKDADARTDLWALGCVLYEMATGVRPFIAQSQASLIAAIMERQPPPMSSLQPVTPPALERIVRRCMAKSRDERFESASDLAFALESVGDSAPTSQSGINAAPAHAAKPRLSAWAVPALMLTVGVALGLLAMRALTPSDGGDAATLSRRFDLVLPDSLPMSFIGSAVIAIEQRSFTLSPKGDRLVYAADDHGVSRLVDMDLVSGTVQKMPGTDGAYAPSFSPDGHWVAFLTIGAVKKIEIGGAGPVALSDLDEPFGVQWQDNERLLTSERQGRILTRVRASGGRLDSLAKAPNAGYNPAITPDAKTLLWSSVRQARAMDIESGELSALTVNGREPVSQATFADLLHGQAPRLLASNQLLYTANGAGGLLMGVPVSPGKLKPLGEPVELASNLRICPNGSLAQYDAVPGLLVYASDPGSGFTHFVRRHPDGRVDSLALPSGEYNAFELSPDGTRIAALLWPPAGKQELWILDIARGTRERVGDATNIITWSADGRAIDYFVTPPISATSASLRLHLDGTGTVDTLVRSDTLARAISPDGQWALRTSLQAYGGYLGTGAGFARSGPVMPNLSSLGRFSPDSRWLATTFSEAGHSEIYVLPVDDPTRRLRVSVAGGEEPRWMPDGRHMVYRYGRDWFEASFDPPAAPGTPPTVGTPVKIFSGPYANLPGYEHSLFPDGSFLLLVDSGVDVTRRLHVITNVESLIRAGAAKAK